jgi:hypothetical protein
MHRRRARPHRGHGRFSVWSRLATPLACPIRTRRCFESPECEDAPSWKNRPSESSLSSGGARICCDWSRSHSIASRQLSTRPMVEDVAALVPKLRGLRFRRGRANWASTSAIIAFGSIRPIGRGAGLFSRIGAPRSEETANKEIKVRHYAFRQRTAYWPPSGRVESFASVVAILE